MVKLNVEPIQVGFTAGCNSGNKLLRSDPFFLGGNHHRGAVRIIGTDKMNGMSIHSLSAHPNVGLNIFHDMSDMEMPIGIGKSSRNEYLAFLHDEMSRKIGGKRNKEVNILAKPREILLLLLSLGKKTRTIRLMLENGVQKSD